MLINEILPSLYLTEYIRIYRIIDFLFPAAAALPFKAYPPRPEQCLQFYPRDLETVQYLGNNLTVSGKRAALVGQHTVVNYRHVGRNFLVIQVVFQPGALYNLTGIPAGEFANTYLDAEDVLGAGIRRLNDQLYHERSYPDMLRTVEQYLYKLTRAAKKKPDRMEQVSQNMLQQTDFFSVDTFVRQACLSHRQFDRRFLDLAGVPPKQFLRITRFDKAFRMKNRLPQMDWLTIALHCGYHDYQHLVKDYKEFTGCTPNQFLQLENNAPERAFGDKEI